MADLKEKLSKIIRDCGDEYYLQETSPEEIVDQILKDVKEAGYVQLDEDQGLPKNPYAGDVAYYDTFREKKAFQVAIAAIRKAGCWRRIKEAK